MSRMAGEIRKNGMKITKYHENPTNRHMSIVFFYKKW